jgi:hypothetical protein
MKFSTLTTVELIQFFKQSTAFGVSDYIGFTNELVKRVDQMLKDGVDFNEPEKVEYIPLLSTVKDERG